MPPSPTGPDPKPIADATYLEQYKAYIQDMANLGLRSTVSQSFYFAIISALLGVIATTSDTSLAKMFTPTFVGVMLFIVVICYVWRSAVLFYNHLFYKKFTVLKELEEKGRLYPMFSREDEIIEENDALLPVPTALTQIQALVPLLIGGVALILAIVALYYLASNP